MNKTLLISFLVLIFSAMLFAQPRPTAKSADPKAPTSYEARYDGGTFGVSGREKGTLKFDDTNSRVTFYRKEDGREMFSIPYEALVVVYPDTKADVPQAGKVLSHVVPFGGVFGLLSTDTRFVILNFDDLDTDVQGKANFKFNNKKSLLNFIHSLGTRAKMIQRGDAYHRPKRATF